MKISPKADPLVKFLHVQLAVNQMSRNELARRAGLGNHTLAAWWAGQQAIHLDNLRFCLEVFGYDMKPTPLVKK